eukprot:GHVT01005803.1.p1 GENE.GHVT01005803.1~~GHVT01005803.1.p1  ORF type:complete len:167 (+),score=34.49 GHVT01005803.1:348-848(+)
MLARLCAFRLRAPLWGGPNGASEFDGSVLAEVATLRARVEALQCGKLLSEFESKHKALRPLLDAAHCSLASHFVTVEVQRSYVLENEGFLLQTAARLKQLHALQEFINPKSVQGVDEYRKRVDSLEAANAKLSLRARRANERLRALAGSYAEAIALTTALVQRMNI